MAFLPDRLKDGLTLAKRLLRALWREEGSIVQRTVRGGIWLFTTSGSVQLLQMVQTAILARLLVAADFGVMQLVLVAVSAAIAFSHLGVSDALVQRKEVSERLLQTAWTMDLARCVVMFIFIQLLAWPAAAFYEEPQLEPLLRLVSVKYIFLGLSNNAGLAMLRRDMKFRRKQLYEVCVNVGGAVVTVALAFHLRSVWALVWGQVFFGAGELVGSYVVHPFRPRFRFHMHEARSLFAFGKHLFAGGILGFARGSAAKVLIGRLLSREELGYYSLAYSLVVKPISVFAPVFGTVLYPAFSRLQMKVQVLQRAFARAIAFGCLLLCPALAGIAVTATLVVRVVYGPRYMPVAPLAMAFCLVPLLAFYQEVSAQLLMARGKPWLNNLNTLLNLVLYLPMIFILTTRYGTMGAVIAAGAIRFSESLVVTFFLRRELSLPVLSVARAALRPLLASILMGVGVLLLGEALPFSAVASLAVLVPAGVVLYTACTAALNRAGWGDAMRLVKGAT